MIDPNTVYTLLQSRTFVRFSYHHFNGSAITQLDEIITICYLFIRLLFAFFFFSSRRRHTRSLCDWSSDVCSSDLEERYVGRALSHSTRPNAGTHSSFCGTFGFNTGTPSRAAANDDIHKERNMTTGPLDPATRRVTDEIIGRLHALGVEASQRDTPEQLARLLDAVEQFERTVERRGGDLMVDEPIGTKRPTSPDDQHCVPHA